MIELKKAIEEAVGQYQGPDTDLNSYHFIIFDYVRRRALIELESSVSGTVQANLWLELRKTVRNIGIGFEFKWLK